MKHTILLVIILAIVVAGTLAYRSIDQRLSQAEVNILSIAKSHRAQLLHEANQFIEQHLYDLDEPTPETLAKKRLEFEAEVRANITRLKAEE